MARKKTQKKKATPRRKTRRKIGAISGNSKDLLIKTAGGVVGVVLAKVGGNLLKNVAVKNFPSVEAYADYGVAAAQFAAGYFLPKVVKQQTPFIQGMQLGMCIAGGTGVVMATGALDSIQGISQYLIPMVAGTNAPNYNRPQPLNDVRSMDVPMVAGMNRKKALQNRYALATHA